MNVLIIFNRAPYDGSDVTWNGLRLVNCLLEQGKEVRIFLMNYSVDIARDASPPPEGYFDLGQMLKDLIVKGVSVKVCGTCMLRCGVHKGEPYSEEVMQAKMPELGEWIAQADKVLTF